MPTLSVQTLQSVQSRLDPRDYVDLAARQEHWGQVAFGKLTDQVLRKAMEKQDPHLDPAEPHRRLHGALLYVGRISNNQFAWPGVDEAQAERIRAAITAEAERVFASQPRSEVNRVDAALGGFRSVVTDKGVADRQPVSLARRERRMPGLPEAVTCWPRPIPGPSAIPSLRRGAVPRRPAPRHPRATGPPRRSRRCPWPPGPR